MIGTYLGHYVFDRANVELYAPSSMGVYYCGPLNQQGGLIPLYVGRALGNGVTILSRLLDHLSDGWTEATHFGFVTCTTSQEAENLEASEIKRWQPKLNTMGKSITLEDVLGLKS